MGNNPGVFSSFSGNSREGLKVPALDSVAGDCKGRGDPCPREQRLGMCDRAQVAGSMGQCG